MRPSVSVPEIEQYLLRLNGEHVWGRLKVSWCGMHSRVWHKAHTSPAKPAQQPSLVHKPFFTVHRMSCNLHADG